ncbi:MULTISPECIES: ribosome maturation factor RimM [unclassified Streptomyces]|uniref:ribosome maturation factor RimM n=1 Tax=unclassified Streptomyces TaxID=2593676 RepID=UPI00081F6ED0|nr:ribosome maturation factor RimM [Streptomyces sp. LcepLS]MYR29733.1 ribosome maturation factor RimM [Streptomyces sp. SID4945]SCF47449.1 16S rRNA processing protein RimM [Streptomyces sp. LcepLS]
MQLVVARIGRAHGIKGEVTVEVRTDEPELRLPPGAVLATDPPGAGPLTIEQGRVHSGRLLLRFAGVKDRTAAEALRNTLLIAEIDPEEVPEDPEEFYDYQLMDLDVVTEDGQEIGRITEISHLPSQDLFIVERPDGSEVMIPFVEEIVTEIDLDEQRAVINPPPGLLDLDEADVASERETSRTETGAAPDDATARTTSRTDEATSRGGDATSAGDDAAAAAADDATSRDVAPEDPR